MRQGLQPWEGGLGLGVSGTVALHWPRRNPRATRQCLLDTRAMELWHSLQLWLSAQDKYWEAWSSHERSLIFQNSNFSILSFTI